MHPPPDTCRRRGRGTDAPSTPPSGGQTGKKEDKASHSIHACPADSRPQLPTWELCVYILVVVTTYGYATYQLYIESHEFQRRTVNGRGMLREGWSMLGNTYQDMMPYEWNHWKFFTLQPTPVAVYTGYIAGGYLTSKMCPNYRKWFMLFTSTVGLAVVISPQVFLLLLLHAVVAYLAAVLGRRAWVVWAMVLAQLALTVIRPFSTWQRSLLPDSRNHKVKFVIAMAFCCLRFIGFGLALLKQQSRCRLADGKKEQEETKQEEERVKEKEEIWTFWDYLLYVFYVPTLPHGPYIQPEGFFQQVKQSYYPSSWVEVRWVCLQWLRPLVCTLFMEFIHHYLYISTFLMLPSQLARMPIIPLIALCEWCTILFQVQYMVYYGLARAMAIFDGVLTPSLPGCLQAMPKASDGWRYFDKGEYQFILRNIYIPFGGSQRGPLRQYLALVASYTFTCFWHGFHSHIVAMVVILWVLVQWEAFSPLLFSKLGITQQIRKLPSGFRHRAGCVLSGMKYPVLIFAIVIFINDLDVAEVYLRRLFGQDALWVLSGLVLIHYCHVMVVEECFRRWGRTNLLDKHYQAAPRL